MKNVLFLFFFSILFLHIQTAQAQEQHKGKTLPARKFERRMGKPTVVVLDVRTLEEFSAGHLNNALLIDVHKDDFIQNLVTLDKNKTYLVYCRSGRRSEKALHLLAEQGFKKAYHLKGGYLNWKGQTIK